MACHVCHFMSADSSCVWNGSVGSILPCSNPTEASLFSSPLCCTVHYKVIYYYSNHDSNKKCLLVCLFNSLLLYIHERSGRVGFFIISYLPTYCTLSASGPSSLSPPFSLPSLCPTYIYIINSLFPSPVRFAFSLVQQEVLSCSALSATLLALI